MSQNENMFGNDAGTDEEFVDPIEPDQPDTQPPAPKSGKPARAPKVTNPKRVPKESKAHTETRPEDPAAVGQSGEKDASAVRGQQAPVKESAAQSGAGAKEKRSPHQKQARPIKSPKQSRPTEPQPPAASHSPAVPATGTVGASVEAKTPRDPGGYPEFHAPTRARKDGKRAQTIVFLHGGNVANWSWDPQVRAFGDYEVLTPHLPGFGARSQEDWAGLDSAADDVAAVIADEVSNGGAHLVGISLGGVIALRVLARHPELVESVLISGVPAAGVSASMRTMSRMQLRLFGSEWYWRFQAGAYGMVADEKELFTEHGTQLRADNMRAIMDEVDPGGVPSKLGAYQGPALVIAGGKEPKLVAKSFPALAKALPQAQFRTAAGMHHQWNIEDPILFNATVRAWVEKGTAHPRLQEQTTQQ
jgi:pimeloyl-ACP methyl ester carboxylesterase